MAGSNCFYRCAFALFLAVLFIFPSCKPDYTPKPRGYFRIEFPEKAYKNYSQGCPFAFNIPVYSKIKPVQSDESRNCWLNLAFPQFNAVLYLSYWPVKSEEMLRQLSEDSWDLAFKHSRKATSINQKLLKYPQKDVYGTLYEINGNTASSLQFYLTDSSGHYFRGALYFNEEPRIDSIQPVLDFIRADIDTLIGSFRWEG